MVRLRVEGECSYEQLVQEHPEGVHVGARVHVCGAVHLLRAHVSRRADDLVGTGQSRTVKGSAPDRLRNAEINDVRQGATVDL